VIHDVISKTDKEIINRTLSQGNDLLIPSSGETAIDIATASSLIIEGVMLGGDINVLRLDDEKVDTRFMSYQINSIKVRDLYWLAQGASVVHLYSNALKHVNVLLPALEEQRKIANALSLLDKKIKVEQVKLKLLQEQKKGFMQQMFV